MQKSQDSGNVFASEDAKPGSSCGNNKSILVDDEYYPSAYN